MKQTAGGQTVKQLKTDSDGNFWLGSIPAGDYTIEFRSPRSPELNQMEFSLRLMAQRRSGPKGVTKILALALFSDIIAR